MSRGRSHSGRARLFYPHPRYLNFSIGGFSVGGKDDAHEPPNPSPDVLPARARALWDDVEAQAWEVYGMHAKQHDIPEKTAWKAVRMHFKQEASGAWVRKSLSDYRLPQILLAPGDTIHLGKLLDYAWITPEGDLYKREFDAAPDLWWNKETKTLYAFPSVETPQHCQLIADDLLDEAQMFKTWAQRKAKCAREMKIPIARTFPRGATDSISYRSDKWHDENPDPQLEGSGEFIHLHGDEVWVWEDCEDADCDPGIIMIRGGRLDVEARGIIH